MANILIERIPAGNGELQRPEFGPRWKESVRKELEEKRQENDDWIYYSANEGQAVVPVDTVMNLCAR
jgi:hypothetical protein